jgi:hypothetical protein
VAAEGAGGAVVLVLAGAGRGGAGVGPLLGVEVVGWPFGVEDAPGGKADRHSQYR